MNRFRQFDCRVRRCRALSVAPSSGKVSNMAECTDRVIGKILAGWRYDISGLAPEMRGDYEAHLAECEHCRSRQRLHRGIDIGLMVLASASMIVFLLAYGVIRHFQPRSRVLAGDRRAGRIPAVHAAVAAGGDCDPRAAGG